MISGKDVRVEGNKLFINGEAYDIVRDTSAIEDEIDEIEEKIGDISQSGLTGTTVAAQLTSAKGLIDGKVEIENTAGFHNSIYRGEYLGSEVTAAQYAAIEAGTFDDMYIGDYWTIDSVNYRIAHFDYWLGTGDTQCTTHHVVLVPDNNLYTAKMNETNVTTGAYVGSAMYTTNLAQAKTAINNAFSSTHILSHRELLANAMKAAADPTYESSGSWYNSTVEIMNERMVYGADVFHNVEAGGAIPYNYTIDKSQLALFALEPRRIINRASWWLRCAASAAHFAHVGGDGDASSSNASNTEGVRPVFAIIAETNREIEETNREIEEVKTAITKKK